MEIKMENKICTKCNVEQPLDCYRVNKGYTEHVCRECNRLESTRIRRTKDGVVNTMYSHQRGSSKKRNHAMPTYTKQELKDWLFSQEKFHTLYDNWKRLDYQSEYKPSVDRLDERIGYTMANIQLVSWGENNRNHSIGIELETSSKFTRPIKQYTLEGELIEEFISVAEASRQLYISTGQIIGVCAGTDGKKLRYKAKGFQFRYADEAGDRIDKVKKKPTRKAKNASGYTGVTERSGRWQAIITCDCKKYTLGTFDTIEEAVEAYNNKAKEMRS